MVYQTEFHSSRSSDVSMDLIIAETWRHTNSASIHASLKRDGTHGRNALSRKCMAYYEVKKLIICYAQTHS